MTGFDNEVIEWDVDVNKQEEADQERVVGWNLAPKIDEEQEAVKELWMELAKERVYRDIRCMEDAIEQKVMWCQEARSSVAGVTAMEIRICTNSKMWCNCDIISHQDLGEEWE